MTIEVTGSTFEDIRSQLEEAMPAGFELVNAPIANVKGTPTIRTVGTFARRDQMDEIEADTMVDLESKVPEGWALLSVLSV